MSELLEAHNSLQPLAPQPAASPAAATAGAMEHINKTGATGGHTSSPHATTTMLWRYRRTFSSSRFLNQMHALPTPPPLLSLITAEAEQLRGLSFLPLVTRWQSLLIQRFSRRLVRAEARRLTVAEAISSLPPSEAPDWRAVL